MRTQSLPSTAALMVQTGWSNSATLLPAECRNPWLVEVDYSDGASVAAARETLLKMGIWDGMLDWAFRATREDARAVLADMVLCSQAALWLLSNPARQAAAGCRKPDLLAAQLDFFSMLTVRGVRAMTAQCETQVTGLRYTPETGDAEADALLGMVVSEAVLEAVASACVGAGEHGRAAVAYEKAAIDWQLDGQFSRAAQAYAKAATAASRQSAREREDLARTWSRSAELWRMDSQPIPAAQALEKAAAYWLASGMSQAAANAWSTAAECWQAGGQPGLAANAYQERALQLGRVASTWQQVRRPEKACVAWRQQAKAWEAAGAPDRAARAWNNALLAAGTEEAVADEVRSGGTPLFQFDLQFEEAAQG